MAGVVATRADQLIDDNTQEADPERFSSLSPQLQQNGWGRLFGVHLDTKNIEICSDPFSIGRKPHCSLVLTDVRISGVHCTIRRGSCFEGGSKVFMDDLRYE